MVRSSQAGQCHFRGFYTAGRACCIATRDTDEVHFFSLPILVRRVGRKCFSFRFPISGTITLSPSHLVPEFYDTFSSEYWQASCLGLPWPGLDRKAPNLSSSCRKPNRPATGNSSLKSLPENLLVSDSDPIFPTPLGNMDRHESVKPISLLLSMLELRADI